MNNYNERHNALCQEFWSIRDKLEVLQKIEKIDTQKLMSVEIAKQHQALIDRLISVTQQLIEINS